MNSWLSQRALALPIALFVATGFLLAGCRFGPAEKTAKKDPLGYAPRNLVISWTANREYAVNSAGGGYRVYYSTNSSVSTATGYYVNVPYVSGSAAPNTATIANITTSARYYFKVLAYSSINTAGSVSAESSALVDTEAP